MDLAGGVVFFAFDAHDPVDSDIPEGGAGRTGDENSDNTPRGRRWKPRTVARTVLKDREIRIQALLFKKLSIVYPITGLTSQAKVTRLEIIMIFSAGNFSDSLR
ncbi:MAG: hypothetical protein PHH75_03425 [Candidatus Omnitrophica bacterium]|nr:hypothetical protein [Candidatus Omnitrophota bacterium]